ncbi:MFS transporter [Cohnella zeiphila]|uniref:MFS transporter n=1 Tax=Cohnella zeiphila TaxID=2761120 RepID=A0A7X0VYR2_9BACL|nr:MFS transporter [Cohnella zeiphila]MBB6735624.1 MFS transporter [Cohnella zeiphila]
MDRETSRHKGKRTAARRAAPAFAAACGLAVASVYYSQPLLDDIAGEFGISRSSVGIVVTVTQLCYALGLLLLVPLGDRLDRRRLIAVQMLLSSIALAAVGLAPSAALLFVGLAVVGLLAVVAQTMVAFAADLAAPDERGRIVGQVTSGIVIGILLARTVAGTLAQLAGWRSVYWFSAMSALVLGAVLWLLLPSGETRRTPSLSYPRLIRSTLALFAEERVLRVRALLALPLFASFSILWTSLVLPLSSPPLSLSHAAIGSFGLAGAAGALAASRAGRLADRGFGQRTTGVSLALLLASWMFIHSISSLPMLILGIVLLDLAVQAVHVTSQSLILAARPEARSRLTAGYMIFYSLGSASGSIASTQVYARAGWDGVCLLGAAVSATALLFWALTLRPRQTAK